MASLKQSMRMLVRKLRPAVYAAPFVGKGLRYLKRLVMLPWNFHKHFQATAEHRALLHQTLHELAQTQRQANVDLVNAQTQALASHMATLIWEELPRQMREHLPYMVVEPVQKLITEFHLGLAEMATELRGLNDRHATCYDRLADQLRQQTAQLRALAGGQSADVARQLAELALAQDDLARQVSALRAGFDPATRLRLTA